MEFTNLARIAIREGTCIPTGNELDKNIDYSWMDNSISEEEALIFQAQCFGNKYTITKFSYNPVTRKGYVIFTRED
jgi:hypothetical protein